MKTLVRMVMPLLDVLFAPFVLFSALLLKGIRATGIARARLSKKIFLAVGVFPIRDHYYEPQFDFRNVKRAFSEPRALPGIDWNTEQQLALLGEFRFGTELNDIPFHKPRSLEFYFDNGTFCTGDAEIWYQLVRARRPRRIFEIGSGNSTLMARRAIARNKLDDPTYDCKHLCVEPYEMPWLEQAGVTVLRKKVEDVELSLFAELTDGDVLFIDSSHVIRPEGDVLCEYLQILPTLNKGVIVHVHDIFSPRNYPERWLIGDVRFWNEQYLLEAFLSQNPSWKIICALNYLRYAHYDRLKAVCPFVTPECDPGSFYMQKVC